MGNFYTNYTLKGPTQAEVVQALSGRTSIVTADHDGYVMVFDEQSDEQDQETISVLAAHLSNELKCAVLAVVNHDDDILWYQLHEAGALIDEYNCSPDYFDGSAEEPAPPAGGDAKKLCAAFGAADVESVESILRKTLFDDEAYAFAFERHEALVKALGLPEFGVGFCFDSFTGSELGLPDGLSRKELIRTK